MLLSSLEGAAITSVNIAGAQHEFSSLPGVVEDVTDIVLNLKKVKFKLDQDNEPRILTIKVEKEGVVTAGDIQTIKVYEVVNKDQVICTLDKKVKFDCEFEVRVGRGFSTGDENKRKDQPIGVIPIDSIFSPVTRVKYAVETTRVGQRTDYDKLILDIWTDGRITPHDALLQASAILRHHLDVFVNYDENAVDFEETPAEVQRGKRRAEEAAQHERQRNRTLRARRQLPEQREHHHRRPARAEVRGGNAQVSQLRQEVAQRDQGQAATARLGLGHEVRARSGGFAGRAPMALRQSGTCCWRSSKRLLRRSRSSRMRHQKKTIKLGRTAEHRKALLANQVCALIEHQRIKTTLAKAKAVRPLAEKMVTLGKNGSIHARRTALAVLRQKDAVKKLFDDIAPRIRRSQWRLHPHRQARRSARAIPLRWRLSSGWMQSTSPRKNRRRKRRRNAKNQRQNPADNA